MSADVFAAIEQLLESGDADAALNLLDRTYREARNYRGVFEARLLRKRRELGMPPYQAKELAALPPELQSRYGDAVTEAAREVGELFLADGDIVNAFPYLRATGDLARIADAIESVKPGEHTDALIEIAFQEGINPAKGLEFILHKYGICQAISALGVAPVEKDRERCIGILARNLHGEIVERMSSAVEQQEGVKPGTDNIAAIAEGREWLFGEYSAYVDTSHLVSILQCTPEVSDPDLLRVLHDLCEYGRRLSPQFRIRGQAPFDDVYEDYDHYALALLTGDDAHLEHFRHKEEAAQVLVRLLVRRDRYAEALEVALANFPDTPASELNCPSALDLCQFAGDFERMQSLARSRNDWLTFTAAALSRTHPD